MPPRPGVPQPAGFEVVPMSTQDCIFCRIGRGDIPAEKLYDDGVLFAIRDLSPLAPTHLLIIPHEHIGPLADAPDAQVDVASRCMAAAPHLAREMGVAENGFRLVVNQGAHAGQEVPHFHMHLLAGRPLGTMG